MAPVLTALYSTVHCLQRPQSLNMHAENATCYKLLPVCFADLQTPCFLLTLQAALADTEVPAVSIVEAPEGDAEPELDVDEEDSVTLDVAGLPLIVTVGQVG